MPQQEPALTFDVVIATRNRPQALSLTVPLLLSQSRRPEKLIVIDSSDDPEPVDVAIAEATKGHEVDVVVHHTEKGLTRQRNRGLAEVTAPIVFFPDDDALFFPGTSEAIMQIYERDIEGLVKAINPADSATPPPGALEAAGYEMTAEHHRMARTVRLRTRLGRWVQSFSPRYYIGRLLLDRAPEIAWLSEFDALLVEWMTGYRMTFRTEAIRADGFEEVFGGYSLFEDTDASWNAWRQGVVVGANRGKIYHHRHPGGRADRYGLGAMGLVNLAYLMVKHGHDLGLSRSEIEETRKLCRRYARLRLFLTRAGGIRDVSAHSEVRGMKDAFPSIDRLYATPRTNLASTYLAIKSELGID